MPDVWEDYVVVHWTFDPQQQVDDVRKEAFRSAAEHWRDRTCIAVVETNNPQTPYIEVGVYDIGSCWAGIGRHSSRKINLGWCNSTRQKGNIVHEIGHILGMNHEQKRPDAGQSYHGQGPYLRIHWENIDPDWTDQYTPDYSSYTGSADDGAADPQVGYAAYDFGSIMQYPKTQAFEPITEEGLGANIGQRAALSDGDILQMLDAYRCRRKSSTLRAQRMPAPTPAPTPAPMPAPTSAPGSCPETCQGHTCNFWALQGYSCDALTNLHRCECSGCSACVSSPSPQSTPAPASSSCPETCYFYICDFWVQQGYSCSGLSSDYGCDCSGCSCS
jgi:hypothetical protein